MCFFFEELRLVARGEEQPVGGSERLRWDPEQLCVKWLNSLEHIRAQPSAVHTQNESRRAGKGTGAGETDHRGMVCGVDGVAQVSTLSDG